MQIGQPGMLRKAKHGSGGMPIVASGWERCGWSIGEAVPFWEHGFNPAVAAFGTACEYAGRGQLKLRIETSDGIEQVVPEPLSGDRARLVIQAAATLKADTQHGLTARVHV